MICSSSVLVGGAEGDSAPSDDEREGEEREETLGKPDFRGEVVSRSSRSMGRRWMAGLTA